MKALKICVGIVLAAVILVAVLAGVLLSVLAKRPAVPEDYTATVETGGPLEERYLAMGGHDVSYFESGAMMSFKKYEIHYPSDIASMDDPLPAVVFVNGTGVTGSKYPALQKHLASWGFITIATEEEYAWNGFSAEMCVRYLELLNQYEGEVEGGANPLLGKVDLGRVGITGTPRAVSGSSTLSLIRSTPTVTRRLSS